jgi:hypothetical protein
MESPHAYLADAIESHQIGDNIYRLDRLKLVILANKQDFYPLQ